MAGCDPGGAGLAWPIMRNVLILGVLIEGLLLAAPGSAQDPIGEWRARAKALTAAEAAALEAHLLEDPTDVETRSVLIIHYFGRPGERDRHDAHALWLVEHAPESDVLRNPYGLILPAPVGPDLAEPAVWTRAVAAWRRHLEEDPENLVLLDGAARSLSLSRPEEASELLYEAVRLDPTNPRWPERLGHLHRRGRDGFRSLEQAAAALEQLERAYELSDLRGRNALLEHLARAAFVAGETAKAGEFAEAMLIRYPDEGASLDSRQTHYGNLTLGRLALRQGDTGEARARLLAAGRIDGGPALSSFGPNMALALDLLEAGATDVVLEYFELCAAFWERGQDQLAAWTEAVEAGEIPNFRGNLIY